jgi:hypothetical protein
MGARILNLNEVEVQPGIVHEPPPCRSSQNLEDHRAKYLISRVNERGQRVWFYQVEVTGLHRRVFGPFRRKSDAIEGFDLFLDGALQALCECWNAVTDHDNRGMAFIQLPSYLDEKGRPA